MFVFAPRRTFKVIGTKLWRRRAIDGLPKGANLIQYLTKIMLVDFFSRSWTHCVFALGVHLGEAQVADGGEGVRRVDHRLGCVTAHTHTWGSLEKYTQRRRSRILPEVVCEDSHDDLLFEERAIKGEGLIFPSLSANVHSVLLGELISETKQHGQTLWSERDISLDSS